MRRPLAMLAFLWVGACGPVQYVAQVTQDASREVAAARSSQADKYAPYEMTMAEEYLHKARELAGYAKYQDAIRFGKKAELMAKTAREICMKEIAKPGDTPDAPVDPSATPTEPTTTDTTGTGTPSP